MKIKIRTFKTHISDRVYDTENDKDKIFIDKLKELYGVENVELLEIK